MEYTHKDKRIYLRLGDRATLNLPATSFPTDS